MRPSASYQSIVVVGRRRLLADEPAAVGGLDSGPNPYDFLSIARGACTAMTLRIYAEHKVAVEHCTDCGGAGEGRTGRIDRFERTIRIEGVPDASLAAKVVEIAGKCPVHRTLEAMSAVVTRIAET